MSNIVKAEPFHIQAYKLIQKEILEKVFEPGQQITEISLANKLGISRGPIREAIRMLVQDGLLVQKGSHTFVFDPTFEDVMDLYLCKERLEPLSARLAAKHIDENGKKELTQILDKIENALKKNEDNNQITTYNTEFHDIILKHSQNKQLIQFMNLIRSKNIYMRNTLLGENSRKEVFIGEYRLISEAIINKNEEKAEILMKKHVEADLEIWKQFYNYKEDA